jgi:acyl carrier protein
MSQLKSREEIFNGIVLAIQRCLKNTILIKETDRLVDDLQFDSLHIATLTFCIEDELDCSLVLNEWVASANDSTELTVSSLVDFVMKKMVVEETV